MLKASLYGLQSLLAYCLMMVAMSFNFWLCIAVVIGHSFGYYVFASWETFIDSVNTCHH